MGKYSSAAFKLFASEKEVTEFLKGGEVGQIVGLFLRKNESYALFYLKDEPVVEIKKEAPKKELRKG
jgi:hypothetical protein